MSTSFIFDFNKNVDVKNWNTVNDDVMGGLSSSSFVLNAEGHGVFSGRISLENNGGFTLVRYRTKKKITNQNPRIKIKLNGDGKTYQFRIKDDSGKYYSYITSFTTSKKWEEIEIPLKEMYPSFRGKKLDLPNFSGDTIEEVVFLIGNKKTEEFQLLLDSIELY